MTKYQSGWTALAGEFPSYARLCGNMSADWLIVGAGVAGICAALELARRFPEQSIVLVDRRQPGQGASARNSGFVVQHELPEQGQLPGQKWHASYLEQCEIGRHAVAEVKQHIQTLDLDCRYEDVGYYFGSKAPIEKQFIDGWVQSLQAGGSSVEVFEGERLAARLGTSYYRQAVWSGGGNALVQPARYVLGLLRKLPASVQVFGDTDITSISNRNTGTTANTPEGTIQARRVLVTVNAFLPRLGIKADRILPIQLCAILTRPLSDQEYAGIGSPASWGMLAAPYLGATVRLTDDRRILVRSTFEFRRKDFDDPAMRARQELNVIELSKRFPWLGHPDVAYTWSGHLGVTRNGDPVFGEVHPGVFAYGGCNGSGLAKGTLYGRLLAQRACGDDSALLQLVQRNARPTWLPPRPFLDIGATLRIAKEHFMARE